MAKAMPWTADLRVACILRCGEFGEPECRGVVRDCPPCEECLAEVFGPAEQPADRCPCTADLFEPT